ncbi:MAG: lytic murein transglycosylase [Pseudomonadales bacterium]|jgi:membrane-bound lytic murein transglycosylase B|nr:lytic murein transglycosylase [Pseudomonadales bacterium]
MIHLSNGCKPKSVKYMDMLTHRTLIGLFTLVVSFSCLTGGQQAHAQATPEAWASCVSGLRQTALQSGISEATVNNVFTDITQLPRVIASDRSQPEFTQTFTEYYNKRVTEFRISKGRNLLATHATLLARIQERTGVPPQYLVAFWGLETNFGSYFGKLPIPSALATLACDSRRSDFFTRELMATLEIVDAGDIASDELVGSWAGAIGHMQFMPTTFLQHAKDEDGDGRRDLLGSVSDALYSGGSYLADMGWEPGFRWGREVRLPEGFDYALTGSDQWRPLSEWAERGVTDTAGRDLEPMPLQSALLLPTGHTGPAFLVYPNFRIIMKWNRSEFYALSVGRLADRIAGAGKLARPLPSVEATQLSTQALLKLQENLVALGFEAGTPDGVMGPATRRAIQNFQTDNEYVADGFPTPALFEAVANAVGTTGAGG